ncbi:MAG TPA: hypothetical protein VFO02_02440 [Burkholderiales bacterium]|nr:hypothetical protein [Burkholderiales bacterium]
MLRDAALRAAGDAAALQAVFDRTISQGFPNLPVDFLLEAHARHAAPESEQEPEAIAPPKRDEGDEQQ